VGENMEFAQYQSEVSQTDQKPGTALTDVAVHLLGLAGEAGSVAAEYKKYLRDGPSHSFWKARMREELGDVLWYVSSLATHLDLDLNEIAHANIEKTRGRWLTGASDPLDSAYPLSERLPRQGFYEFVPTTSPAGREAVTIWFQGQQVGSLLTDAAHVDDGYRFHDAFHLSYAIMLGWSPVTRALLDRKRRSQTEIDENEDGGRAVVVEEGIAALVFGYAAQHHMLDGVTRLDQKLLDAIELLASGTEVGVRSQADWERAVLAGFAAFRSLLAEGGGTIHFDADTGEMRFDPAWSSKEGLAPPSTGPTSER
jgi:NTP pyrophosphatase (non-canonical NTP hydrolase)